MGEWAYEEITSTVTTICGTKTVCPWLEMCICGWLGTGMMYLCVWVAYRLQKQMLSATDCAHIQLPARCPAVPSWLPAARYWIFVNFGQATRYVAFLESLKYTQNACFVLNASRSAFEILDWELLVGNFEERCILLMPSSVPPVSRLCDARAWDIDLFALGEHELSQRSQEIVRKCVK